MGVEPGTCSIVSRLDMAGGEVVVVVVAQRAAVVCHMNASSRGTVARHGYSWVKTAYQQVNYYSPQ